MASQEQGVDKIKYLIEKLRSITLAVQIGPFAYTFLYIVALILYLFLPESSLWILDTLFYTSPVIVAEFFVFSRILKLCRWHRRACALPLIPQIFVLIDRVTDLTKMESYIAIGTPLILGVLLLIAAYNVFLK